MVIASIVAGMCYDNAMSDIAIRFDGLVLAASLAFGATVFFALALITALLGLSRRRPAVAVLEDARRPLLFAVLSAAALGGVVLYMERAGPPSGPDWIDWLSLAYLPLLIAGCIAVVRPAR
jgi:hypothetical protein